MIFLNRMTKGQGKAFAEAWRMKIADDNIPDTETTYRNIAKAFKTTFSPYDIAASARVRISSIIQDLHDPKEFDKFLSEFTLRAV